MARHDIIHKLYKIYLSSLLLFFVKKSIFIIIINCLFFNTRDHYEIVHIYPTISRHTIEHKTEKYVSPTIPSYAFTHDPHLNSQYPVCASPTMPFTD